MQETLGQRTPRASGPGPDTPGTRPLAWIAGVCVAFVCVQLVLVVPGSGMGWDETVYLSQVSRDVPTAFFSAPRARGISYLTAPLALFTSSVTAVRLYFALLSGIGLFVALWVWRSLIPARVLATAGGLFATLWITLSYGPTVMPNLWSAFGTLAAVGCFARAARDGTDRRAMAGLAASVVVVALMRPPDAVWLVAALAAAALAVPRWRRPVLLLLLGGALALGSAEWIIEAYARYGGLFERLQRASEIQHGMGWHMAVDDQIRSMDGRSLCRPCNIPWRHPVTALWWFALPLLTVTGVLVAPRARRDVTALLPALTALVVAVPYLFLISFAAPRFLLPAYALLALPVAEALWRIAGSGGRFRALVTAALALGLAGHLAVQIAVVVNNAATSRTSREDFTEAAARLHELGIRPPCVLSGDYAVQLSYYARCASRQTAGPDESTTPDGVLAAARSRPVGVLVPPGAEPPAFARDWRPAPLPAETRFSGYHVRLPPDMQRG